MAAKSLSRFRLRHDIRKFVNKSKEHLDEGDEFLGILLLHQRNLVVGLIALFPNVVYPMSTVWRNESLVVVGTADPRYDGCQIKRRQSPPG